VNAPVIVLQSRPTACVVCGGKRRVRQLGWYAQVDCPHCVPDTRDWDEDRNPVVYLPWRPDSKDLRRTS